jgi:hypothetical protein
MNETKRDGFTKDIRKETSDVFQNEKAEATASAFFINNTIQLKKMNMGSKSKIVRLSPIQRVQNTFRSTK